MWQQFDTAEEISIGSEIDAQDPFNRYADNASAMAKTDLPFYPGAQLVLVTNRQPAVGNRYFMRHLRKDVRSKCVRQVS